MALADGVRALAEAMGRAPAEALTALAERMAVVVRELTARREANGKGSAEVVDLGDERRRRER